ncbi:methyltransferase domain-containing protein [Streptomyces carminius]|nr:methyltransferase domain-containing protein [Streptomyces carminius]
MTTPAPTATDPARGMRTALAHQLTDPADPWRPALEQVPRHLFVPSFLEQDNNHRWRTVTADTPDYWQTLYSDRALTTQLTDGTPTSSSSQPSLMLDMLHALDITDGHRVLEIGTGTGYNAALLACRLGHDRVTTVDVDPDLTRTAAARLAQAGYLPAVHTGDGAAGAPHRAPYDRIIATCAMTSIPPAWIEQATNQAIIVTPIGWGIARLTVHHDRAEGRFLPGEAYFMPRRTPSTPPDFAALHHTAPRPTPSTAPLGALQTLRFPLSLTIPGHQWCTWTNDDTKAVKALGLWTPDGSTAHIHADGTVRQTGPRRLWNLVEELHEQFSGTAPAREEFGITATPHRQWAWLDDPHGPGWDLPSTTTT